MKKLFYWILKHQFILNLASLVYYFLHFNRKKIRGKNNQVDFKGAFLKNVKIEIRGNNNLIKIEKGAILENTKILIYGNNHTLKIGERCWYKGFLWFEDNFGTILIGAKTTVEKAHIAVTEPQGKIEIGEDCMISFDVDIRNGDSHSIIELKTKQRINFAKNILIGKHVWIGAYSQILKGVKIGDNSIVGTKSLVTKNIPAHSIVGGIPAKILKNEITWERERRY